MMGNENEFIKIDDLFRDLKYGEEREPAGAWWRMDEILDADMPSGLAVSRPSRRYLILLLALLAIGCGALYYFHSTGNLFQAKKETAVLSGSHTHNNGILSNEISAKTSSTINADAKQTAPETTINKLLARKAAESEKNNILASTSKTLPHNNPALFSKVPAGSASVADVTIKKTTRHKDNLRNTAVTNAITKRAEWDLHPLASSAYVPLLKTDAAASAWTAPVASVLPPLSGSGLNASMNTAAPEVIKEEKVLERFDPKTGKELKDVEGQSASSGTGLPEHKTPGNPDKEKEWIPVTGSHDNIVKNKNGQYYKEERDTLKQYQVTKKQIIDTRRMILKRLETDTIAIATIERVKYTAIPLSQLTGIIPASGVPAGSLTATATAGSSTLVPLANFKVKSRKIAPNAFHQLQNTTNGLASVFNGTTNWYAALLLGGNASFGNPGAFGLQAGVAVFYSFAERWSLSAGVNFMNKYFPSYQFTDEEANYNVDRTKIPGGWQYSGTGVTHTNSYAVGNMNTLNLPVYLNYNLTARLSVFGGANVCYALPLKWTKENSVKFLDIDQTESGNVNPFTNTTFKVDEQKDFAPRLGIGYIGGMSYDLSRTLSLDARVQQSLWNNGSKNMQEINKLFQKPSFELSFSYYFGRKEKVIYILDSRK